MMLSVSEEAGYFIELKSGGAKYYQTILEELNQNRLLQQSIIKELKSETQFNKIVKINTRLRELQDQENELKRSFK